MKMPPDENVYAAPEARELTTPRTDEAAEGPDLRFMALWEQRRAAYNLVLVAEVAAVVLLLGRWHWLTDVIFWEMLVGGAICANLCFCAGPVGEAYLRWIGLRGKVAGPIVFGLGMLVAMAGTLMVLIAYAMAGVNF